jgi:hypothetical protein
MTCPLGDADKLAQIFQCYTKLSSAKKLVSEKTSSGFQLCAVPQHELVDGAIEYVTQQDELVACLFRQALPLPPILVAFRHLNQTHLITI